MKRLTAAINILAFCVMPALVFGQTASPSPKDFKLPNVGGPLVASLQGKPVLVFLWAYW